MRINKLGLFNLGVALIGQVIAWSWVASRHGTDTAIGAIVFAITLNLVPYGCALLLSSLRRQLGILNIISILGLVCLAFVYWDGLLKPANSTSVIALLFWPIWHLIAITVISGFIFFVTRRSSVSRQE